ncbi:MAG: hypothetical protein JXA89_23650 [Anaerolineae bacterium]|nr:hypothetical protein [Anaerolineae bacterium]
MDDQVRKKKTIILLLGAAFLMGLVGVLPVHSGIRAVVMGDSLPAETVIVRAATASPAAQLPPTSTSLVAAVTPTPLPPTATPEPTKSLATPTPLPPTATLEPTKSPATPTPPPPTRTPAPTPTVSPPATVAITAPVDGADVETSGLAIEGTAPAGSTVVIYDGKEVLGTVTAGDDGRWRYTLSLPWAEGEHILTVRVRDQAQVGEPSEAIKVTALGHRLPVTGGETSD